MSIVVFPALSSTISEVWLVLVLVLLVAIGAVVLGAGSLLFGAGRSFDDVERFHRARGITTGWARDGVVRPVIGGQKQAPSEQTERAGADL